MDIDEFAEWFDKYCSHDSDPCVDWWNNAYCSNCKPVIGRYPDSSIDMEFSWCELNNKCRFFQDVNEIPDALQMTKLWLKSKY